MRSSNVRLFVIHDTSIKKRIVVSTLVVLTVWPLVHYGLARITGFDPWKGFGWAMYCVPPWHFEVKVRQIHPPQQPEVGQHAMQVLQQVQTDFLKFRGVLGPLAKPDKVAQTIFYLGPNVNTIEIYVLKGRVDPRTAMYVEEGFHVYLYQRPGRLLTTQYVKQ